MSKTPPDGTLAQRCREAGASVQLVWEIPGPKGTLIAWLSGYSINGQIVMVQTYIGVGWEAFTACGNVRITETVEDVLRRVGFSR